MVKCVKRLPSQWVNHQDSTELGSPARASGGILTEANKLNASLRTETAKWAKDCPRDRGGNIRHFAVPPTGCGVSLFTQSTSFRKQQQQPKQDYAEELQGGGSLESGTPFHEAIRGSVCRPFSVPPLVYSQLWSSHSSDAFMDSPFS